MAEHDPQELAERLEQEADDLERQGAEVKGSIEETRDDWERKRRDESVPGAPPPEDSGSDDPGQADDA